MGWERDGWYETFFVLFDQTWIQVLASMEFHKENFISQSLRKIEAILLPTT